MLVSARFPLCLSLLASLGTAQAALKEWPRVRAGTTVYYQTSQHVTQTTGRGKSKHHQVFMILADETHSVLVGREKGTLVFTITPTRVWGKIRDGREKTVAFDTAANDPIPPGARDLVDTLLTARKVVVDRSGTVLSVQGKSDGGKWRDLGAHERETTQLNYVQVPPLPTSVGVSWRPTVGIHECTTTGCVELETRNEVASIAPDRLTVSSLAEIEDKSIKSKHSVKRTVSLSLEDGMPLDLKVQARSRNRKDATEQRATIQMRRSSGAKRRTGRSRPPR